MTRQRLTTWWLLAAMALLFSGAAQPLHERLDHHHGPTAPHASAEWQGPPAALGPLDHDDCATCFLLVHGRASPLDLQPPPKLFCPSRLAPPTPAQRIVARDDTPLPPGRGPPHVHL